MGKRLSRADGLNDRQRRFAAEYLKDLNAKQAAIRAGYSAKTADRIGSRLLSHVEVAAAIASGQAKRADRLQIDSDRVLAELARSAFADPAGAFTETGAIRPIHDMPEDVRRAISSYEIDADGAVKVKFWSKPQTLEALGRHLKLFDRAGEEPIETLTPEERARRVVELVQRAKARALAAKEGA